MQQPGSNLIYSLVEKRNTESAKTILLLGTLGSWVAVVAYFFAQLEDTRYVVLTIVGILVAISITISNFLIHRNQISLAIWLFIFATEIIFITIGFTITNLGIILSITLISIIGSLALQSLSKKETIIAMTTAIITNIIILLIDTLRVNHLDTSSPNYFLLEISVIVSGIILMLIGMELLSHYKFHSIRSQIIVAFIVISVVPLFTATIIQLIANSSLLEKNTYTTILSDTNNVTKDFNDMLIQLKNTNISDAELPIFKKFIDNNNVTTRDDILDYFTVMKKRNSNIIGYSLIDKTGKVLVETNSSNDFNIDAIESLKNKKSSISDINYDLLIKKHVFYITSPIPNTNTNIDSVLRVEINADILQNQFETKTTIQDKDTTVILINRDGIILASNASNKTRFKLIAPIKQNQLSILQKKNVLESNTLENLNLNLIDLQQILEKSNNPNLIFQAPFATYNSEVNAITYRNIASNEYWKIVVGLPISKFSESANTQTRITILIVTILMLIALTVSILIANILTSPLNYLISASEKIKHGEGYFQITLERHDELGKLADAFNTSTLKLKETLESTENQVNEQTINLTAKNKNLEQQVERLNSILKITNKITSTQHIDELFHVITQQISTVFGFYHVGIFLSDQTGKYTILQAANSEAGQKMLKEGYILEAGQTDNISFAISSGKINIALDISPETAVSNNPYLPNTRLEIIIPLQIDENIIGALDLHGNTNTNFNANDMEILVTLANQISIVIQNAQLFEATRNELTEAQVFYQQSATASWRDLLHQGTRGYRYINGSVDAIKISNELSQKTNSQSDKKSIEDSQELLIIPINIRGKSLGTLKIHQTERNHAWSSAEIRVYKSIVDRISFALENARLYQDAQRRAAKERVISEISTKVSSSVNMDNILQTAVEELGRVLPGSEIVIQLEHEDETNTEFRAQE